MREKLRRFMQGRNGYDAFSRFLVWLSIALLLLSLFLGRPLSGLLARALWVLAVAAVAYAYFRAFSKNVYKRQSENRRYLQAAGRVKSRFASVKQRWKDRRDYKYFRCPDCKSLMRVPRHKGKIRISCKSCGNRFERRT